MSLIPTFPFPEHEHGKLKDSEALMRDWQAHFDAAAMAQGKQAPVGMTFDGFYPWYFTQNPKILFIARESRGLTGLNYLECLLPAYRTEKRLGGKTHLNKSLFHSRLLRIAYGLTRGVEDWKAIPLATKIGDSFGAEGGTSFAFMNISKLSNENAHWGADYNAINFSHSLSTQSRNFTQEQIALLEPDIVITMGLGGKLWSLGDLQLLRQAYGAKVYRLNTRGHSSLLLETFHFAAWRKRCARDFYQPIWKAVQDFHLKSTEAQM